WQLRATQGVITRNRNLGAHVIGLVWFHVSGQSVENGVLRSLTGENHGVGRTVDGSARCDLSTVVFQERLETEADAQQWDLAQDGVDEFHHAAGISGVSGSWGEHNQVRGLIEYFRHCDGIAHNHGVIARKSIDKVINERIVIIEK